MAEEKQNLATQLFTVRFWLETLGNAQHEWRGRAQYIESGEVIYFRDWQELYKFIRDNLDRAIQPNSEIQIRRIPMLTFACKDAGVDCAFVATGNSVDEVKQAAFAHAEVVHKDLLQSMTQEQLDELAKTVESHTKPA